MKKIEEDTEHIQNILNENPQSQEILYKKYSKIVKSFLTARYSIYYDLDDDVSEIMIKIFTKLPTYDNEKSKFSSWVFTIAKNHMIDKWRGNLITVTGANATYTTSIDQPINMGVSNSTGTVNFSNSYTTSSCGVDYNFENCSSINHISTQLTAQEFMLLDMKYVQGYNYTEIGSEFNLTSSTISNKVNYINNIIITCLTF